jgi:hypothetical protein
VRLVWLAFVSLTALKHGYEKKTSALREQYPI